MKVYTFDYDITSLEIFPKEVWQNPFVVFHGTSEFHSSYIDSNGFIKGYIPFDKSDGYNVVDILEKDSLKEFDTPNFSGQTIAQRIKHYLDNIENNIRLSFSPLSSACISFATQEAKGGQIFMAFRDAKLIIDKAKRMGVNFDSIDLTSLERIITIANQIDISSGVIYAVKIPEDLKGFSLELNVVYSIKNIPAEEIIGKIIINATTKIPEIDKRLLKDKLTEKLFKTGRLGILFNRK